MKVKRIRAVAPFDESSLAKCTCADSYPAWQCPRHKPDSYADASAKHVSNVFGTGSI